MRNPDLRFTLFFTVVLAAGAACLPNPADALESDLPMYLRDRGTGLSTSMFGTYIREGELLVYPFFEYYLDDDMEYKPAEFGYGLDQDLRGKYRAYEGLIFVGYGLADWLALELEAAVISATLEKSSGDPSAAPNEIKESGLGDVEGQLRLRWMREHDRRPELFSYFETVAPLQKDKVLIGTQDWEFKAGIGLIKGFSWGTMTIRVAGEYSIEESKSELGEYAVEYLKRLSPAWRVYLGVEGAQDEVELIPVVQWHITDSIFLNLNNAFGITSKATDWAPEIGIMCSFPVHNQEGQGRTLRKRYRARKLRTGIMDRLDRGATCP